MKKNLIYFIVSYIAKIMTQGAKAEIQMTFKEAITNDFEEHKLNFLSIPVFILLSVQLFGLSLTLLTYSLVESYVYGSAFPTALMFTSLILFMVSMFLAILTYYNIQMVLKRVEMMRTTMAKIKQVSSPFQKIYDQFQHENKMILDNLMTFKQNQIGF